MKFIDKFLEKKRGKIVFSFDETVIYEEENIFQTIENTGESILKYLNLYTKKLKGFSETDIFINEGYFKIFETEAETDEVSEKNRDRFIEYETKIFLNEDNLDDYFIKYFKEGENRFVIYILDRGFVENLVEFFLTNKIKVGKIILNVEKSYFIDDYDSLLKRDTTVSLDKKGIGVIFTIALIFSGLYLYGKYIDKKITEADKKIILAEEELNSLKTEENNINNEIEKIREEKEKLFDEGLLFSEKIFRILKIMPEEIKVEKIYYEKGYLNIRGRAPYEPLLFDFSEILEKEEDIFSVKYDYIIKKENSFEFLLELRV